MANKKARNQKTKEGFTDILTHLVCDDQVVGSQLVSIRSQETDPVFSFVLFCFTKKADSRLLLRTGTRTICRFWLSNDLAAPSGLYPSTASCK